MANALTRNGAPWRLTQTLSKALFPAACPLCRAATVHQAGLCASCWREMAFLGSPGCRTCSRPIPGATEDETDLVCEACLTHPPAWDTGLAVFRYEGAGRRLILALKHGDRHDLVPVLGRWALRRAAGLIGQADLIAPVPLHWRRRLKRRGNQSAELARWLAHAADQRRAYAPRLLVRTRATSSQDGKNRAQRHANLSGALGLGKDARRLTSTSRVLLIDDVLTTGATLNAATAVLKAAGVPTVDVLVLALVMRDDTAYMVDPSKHAEAFGMEEERLL